MLDDDVGFERADGFDVEVEACGLFVEVEGLVFVGGVFEGGVLFVDGPAYVSAIVATLYQQRLRLTIQFSRPARTNS